MKRILCYGDSNTHGTPPVVVLGEERRFDEATRWPCVLAAQLGPDFTVLEEGLPGRTTCLPDPVEGDHMNGLAVLPALLVSHKPLDLVILKLGTNDLKERFSMTGFDIGTGMRRLVNCVAEYLPNTQVLVVCPPPVVETGVLAEMFTGAANRGRTMPENMLRICRETGAGFFDAGTVIQTDPIDGIHYGAAAQVALGRALDPEVRKILAA